MPESSKVARSNFRRTVPAELTVTPTYASWAPKPREETSGQPPVVRWASRPLVLDGGTCVALRQWPGSGRPRPEVCVEVSDRRRRRPLAQWLTAKQVAAWVNSGAFANR
jgi:hypothetical protein